MEKQLGCREPTGMSLPPSLPPWDTPSPAVPYPHWLMDPVVRWRAGGLIFPASRPQRAHASLGHYAPGPAGWKVLPTFARACLTQVAARVRRAPCWHGASLTRPRLRADLVTFPIFSPNSAQTRARARWVRRDDADAPPVPIGSRPSRACTQDGRPHRQVATTKHLQPFHSRPRRPRAHRAASLSSPNLDPREDDPLFHGAWGGPTSPQPLPQARLSVELHNLVRCPKLTIVMPPFASCPAIVLGPGSQERQASETDVASPAQTLPIVWPGPQEMYAADICSQL
jgi:hypothetical protein